MKRIALIAVLLCTTGAAQAEPMPELGLPLGKKMHSPIALCQQQEAGVEAAADAAAPCWLAQPATLEGGILSGKLKVPASVAGPRWSAPGTYGAAIDRNGVLRAVTVYSARADEYGTISHALSQGFGKPRHASRPGVEPAIGAIDMDALTRAALTERFGERPWAANAGGPRYMAWWKVEDADVTLKCSADIGCTTRFSLDNGEGRRLQDAMNAGMR